MTKKNQDTTPTVEDAVIDIVGLNPMGKVDPREATYAYWFGICFDETVDPISDPFPGSFSTAGITFAKTCQRKMRRRVGGRNTLVDQSINGCVAYLTVAQLKEMALGVADRVVRTVNRTHSARLADGSVDTSQKPPQQWVTIQRKVIWEDREKGTHAQFPGFHYQQHHSDRPLAGYLYCVPCEGERTPGIAMPEPMSRTGLAMPKKDTPIRVHASKVLGPHRTGDPVLKGIEIRDGQPRIPTKAPARDDRLNPPETLLDLAQDGLIELI